MQWSYSAIRRVRIAQIERWFHKLEGDDDADQHAYNAPKHRSDREVFHDPVVIGNVKFGHSLKVCSLLGIGFFLLIFEKHSYRWSVIVFILAALYRFDKSIQEKSCHQQAHSHQKSDNLHLCLGLLDTNILIKN
jgi:hypothetical protein